MARVAAIFMPWRNCAVKTRWVVLLIWWVSKQMTYPEQKRVFRLIPGLEQAEFLRFGSLHRNTYINSPKLLRDTLQFRNRDDLFFAGQITGVEGYTESVATGLLAGLNAVRLIHRTDLLVPPPNTARRFGAVHCLCDGPALSANEHQFRLLPELPQRPRQGERRRQMVQRALTAAAQWRRVGHASGGMMATASASGSPASLNTTAWAGNDQSCLRDAVHSGISPLPER